MTDWQLRSKDDSPKNTINNIDTVLKKLDLTATLEEFSSGLDCCFSSKLNIVDKEGRIIHRSCGKGMTKELSNASAYGEMIERLQGRYLSNQYNECDENIDDIFNLEYPLYDIYDQDQPQLIKELLTKISDSINFPVFAENKYEFVVDYIANLSPLKEKGKFPTRPYYNVFEKKYEYLPIWLLTFSITKGYSAGNTLEEALVEGLSELCEIYVQMKLFSDKIVPPVIPDSVIKRYPHIADMINDIEKTGKYKVRLLDCSLGIGLPVVCGHIINLNTGHFSNKCGSHPNIALAIERVLTETMQGRELDEVVNNDYLDFYENNSINNPANWNLIKVGIGRVPASHFLDKPSYEFKEWDDVNNLSNKELLNKMLGLFKKIKKNVYIYDASYLGFPTVHIYIPEFSEVKEANIFTLKEWKLSIDIKKIFSNLDDIDDEDYNKLLLAAKYKMDFAIDNTINFLSGNLYDKKFIGNPLELYFLIIMLYYYFDEIKKAIDIMDIMLKDSSIFEKNDLETLNCIYYYLQGISSKKDINKIKNVIKNLFPDVCDYVFDLLDDKKNVLKKLYPLCKNHECTKCQIPYCYYRELHDLYVKLVAFEKNNPIEKNRLEELLN